MRRFLTVVVVLGAMLVVPAQGQAAISNVFANDPYGSTNPAGGIPCTVQVGANEGIRLCTATTRSTAKSFDGMPIDVNVMFPPEPADPANDVKWPLMIVGHGYGGSKSGLASNTLRWLNKGYAVISSTDRGFAQSCGTSAARTAGGASCNNGYIRLQDTRYEVRDTQEFAGMLADQGVINGQKVGVIGPSYGGGKALTLAALKDRKMLPNGTLIPWVSPINELPMRIAASTPEAPWSDLAYSLNPTGATLDYAAQGPYYRPGVHRVGVQKQNWQQSLYLSGALTGYYCGATGTPSAPCTDTTADVTGWNNLGNTGGPYDTGANAAAVANEITELTTYHGANTIDDSQAPAPVLISNGWNDDLFPVDEALRYYNRVRTDQPTAKIALFPFDQGVHGRGQGKAADNALLVARENAWMDHYVKGEGEEPQQGVDTMTTACPSATPSAGPFHTDTWKDQSPGELRLKGAATKTIAATVASGAITTFNNASGGPCGTASATDNASTANYRMAPAPAGGFTIVGSPTVIADYQVTGGNDQVAVRLLDVDPTANTEALISRGLWRPKVDPEFVTDQVFQTHPQAYKVAEGHVVKLELLPHDSSYGRAGGSTAPQQPINVKNLELRVPVRESAGSLDGLVKSPADKVVPTGYAFAAGYTHVEPETAIDSGRSGASQETGAEFTYSATGDEYPTFQCRLDSSDAADWTACGSPNSYSDLADGSHTFEVRGVSRAGTPDSSPASRTFTVDTTAPDTTIDDGPAALGNDASPAFEFSSSEAGSTFECRLDSADDADWEDCDSPNAYADLNEGEHTFEVRATDAVGNTDGSAASRTFTIDVTAPQTTIDAGPAALGNDASPAFEFSSSEAGSTFECRLDSTDDADWEDCDSPNAYADLSDGERTFEVRATDPAGNTDPTSAAQTFTVDTTAPQTTIDSGPTGTVTTSSVSFTFSSEAGATFECRLDGSGAGGWSACTSPKAYSGLSEGSHTFKVRGADALGNVEANGPTATFTVATPPQKLPDAPPAEPLPDEPSGPTAACRRAEKVQGNRAERVTRAARRLQRVRHAHEQERTEESEARAQEALAKLKSARAKLRESRQAAEDGCAG